MPKTSFNVPVHSIVDVAATTESPKALWLRRRLGALRWSGKGLLALVDQALISGSNYLMAILLARHLTAQQYGSYALAFELFLLMAVAYGALVLEPFSVFGPSVYLKSLTTYLGSLLRVHVVSGAFVAAVVGTAAWIAYAIEPGAGLASGLLGAAIAGPCVLLFWLARRAFYVKFSPHLAVLGAMVYSAVLLGGLLVVYRIGLLSPLTAFLLMAAGAVATTPAMLARLKPNVVSRSVEPNVSEVVRKHWGYGRWALASSVMVYLSSAIFYPLLASFQGLADAGALKALMNFASPIGQVFAALSLLSLPYSARVHHQDGFQGTRRLVWKLTLLYGGGTFLYWVVIVALRQPLVHYLYGGKYMSLTTLLPWVALGSVFRISATSFAVTLRAMNAPQTVFIAYSVSSAAAILIGAPLTWLLGLQGAVFAFVLSGAVSCIVALMLVQRRYPLAKPLTAI